MDVSLVMVTSDGATRELPVASLPLVIGRSTECKLRVPLASVSRQHCELLVDDDELVVRDLKSSNGTFVNKERIKSRELLPGDLLSVGPVVFVVKIDGFPKDIDPSEAYSGGSMSADGGPAHSGDAIDGVPTWSGQAPPQASAAKPAPAPQKAADEGDIGKLLEQELSESDFDIDFGEEEPPKS